MYTDCTVFPELGQPQKRPYHHPPMALICEPHAPATFEWCMRSCSVAHTGGKQNCSEAMCTCTERCMGSAEVCTGQGANPPSDGTHESLPDALAAVPGDATMLLDGVPPTHYKAASTHKLTVVPSTRNASEPATWFLLDAGVGQFSPVPGTAPDQWKVQCAGTRASFVSRTNAAVDVLWTAPPRGPAAAGAVTLRVAEAMNMGNLTVTAAVLNVSAPALPVGVLGYACTTSEGFTTYAPFSGVTRQCQSVPVGTVGALTKESCEATCLSGKGTFRCPRCAHVYDPQKDGNGTAFEDLPADWACPVCGAHRSAYAKVFADDGSAQWVHED